MLGMNDEVDVISVRGITVIRHIVAVRETNERKIG